MVPSPRHNGLIRGVRVDRRAPKRIRKAGVDTRTSCTPSSEHAHAGDCTDGPARKSWRTERSQCRGRSGIWLRWYGSGVEAGIPRAGLDPASLPGWPGRRKGCLHKSSTATCLPQAKGMRRILRPLVLGWSLAAEFLKRLAVEVLMMAFLGALVRRVVPWESEHFDRVEVERVSMIPCTLWLVLGMRVSMAIATVSKAHWEER